MEATRHVIVCGLGRFGLRVVECLREQDESAAIVVITDASTRADRVKRAQKLRAHLVVGDFRFADVRAEAQIADATAVILTSSVDADCLAAALDIRGEFPALRILMRLDEGRIADRLMRDFGIDFVSSPPALAAPQFSRAALSVMQPASPQPRRELASLDTILRLPHRYDGRRPLVLLALAVFALFAAGVLVFQHMMNISTVDAIYFTATILTTVGFGDYNLMREGAAMTLFGTLLMFAGVTLIALLTSFTTNFFLSGAASRYRSERIAAKAHDHVIVCGLGSVGFEIVRDLVEQKVPVVVIDNSSESGAVRLLEGRVAVIIGDAVSEEALLRAGVGRARALISCLSDDAKNLEIGLIAQSVVQSGDTRAAPLRVILRCFDADLARRIHAASSDYVLLSSAEIAAPVFARAALA